MANNGILKSPTFDKHLDGSKLTTMLMWEVLDRYFVKTISHDTRIYSHRRWPGCDHIFWRHKIWLWCAIIVEEDI